MHENHEKSSSRKFYKINVAMPNALSQFKKIDFVILEMLREINTILAKVSSVTLKELGLSIKILIEEMREQVQNVE